MIDLTKPARGSGLLARKTRQKAHKAREEATMREARVRDGNRCRVPRCRYKNMPVDVCHVTHRGMGGNPKEDRTTRDQLWAGCRIHHGEHDTTALVVEPLTTAGMDGPAAWYLRDKETGKLLCIGVESTIGVSVERAL